MQSNKLISIVVPAYNEEGNLDLFHKKISEVFSRLPEYDYEIIFVNDGSKDKTIAKIRNLAEKNRRIKALDFSRNFGKEVAASAGVHFSQGSAVIIMDADLQHPPSLIPEFLKKWREGYEIVYTVRKENKGASLTKKITSKIYWRLFDKITSVEMEPHSTDFRLLDKKVIKEFKKFPERGRIFRGIVDWMGYKRTKLEFAAPERYGGKATYSYGKLISLAINSFTAFSFLPLRLAGYFGAIITSFSFILLVVMLTVRWLVNPAFFSPLALMAVSNTLLIGIVLICLGFIALYIARIHEEVVGRPLYIIRNKINIENE